MNSQPQPNIINPSLLCRPPVGAIFRNLRDASSPTDPLAQFSLLHSTPDFPFVEMMGDLELDCHHCHQPHVIEYRWAIFKTGAPARAPQAYTIEDRLTDHFVEGVRQTERCYHIGDYIGTITLLKLGKPSAATLAAYQHQG